MADEVDVDLETALDAELAKQAETPVTQDQPPPPTSSLVEFAKTMGLDVDPTATDDDVKAYFTEQQTAADRAAQLEARNRELEAFYAQQPQRKEPEPKPVETPATPSAKKREVPEYDPEWESVLKLDADGNIVRAFDWVDPSIPGKYQRYQKWEKQERARLLREPDAVLAETGYEEGLKARLLTPYEQRLKAIEDQLKQQQQQHVLSARDQFLIENAHFYAQLDAEGKPVPHADGGFVGGDNYQRFAEYEAMLEKAGVADPQARLQLAMKAVPPTNAPQTDDVGDTTALSKKAVVRRKTAKITRQTLAQPPVSRVRSAAAEPVSKPGSIGQLKNRWRGMLEQAVGEEA